MAARKERNDGYVDAPFSFDAEWRLLMHLEHTPGLQALAKRLKEKLARREVDAHEEEAALQEALVNNRLKCLQVKIIEVALEELLHGHLRTSDRSSEREKLWSEFDEAYFEVESMEFIDLSGIEGSEEAKLLSLTHPDLMRPVHYKPEARAYVMLELEDWLFAQCCKLLSVMESTGGETNEDLTASRGQKFRRIFKLPEMVREEVNNARWWRVDKVRRQDVLNNGKQLELLQKSFDLVHGLATKHRAGTNVSLDDASTKLISAKCRTMELKIRSLELEILAATYASDSTLALKKIRNHLKANIQKTKEHLNKTAALLTQYEDAGETLDEVAKDYAQVKREIDNKKWALNELKQTKE